MIDEDVLLEAPRFLKGIELDEKVGEGLKMLDIEPSQEIRLDSLGPSSEGKLSIIDQVKPHPKEVH